MRIVIPHPRDFACPAALALKQEGLEIEVIELEDEYHYSKVLTDEWKKGEGFVLVEADIVPWPGAITALWKCKEIWCGFEYPQGKGVLDPGLGCVKFSKRLVVKYPDLYYLWADKKWPSLDSHVISAIWAILGKIMHIHNPPVAHARERTD